MQCVQSWSSLRNNRFFSFPGGDRTSERRSGRAKDQNWGEQTTREKWGGVSEKGEGLRRKGITWSQSQTFYRAPCAHERATIVRFDWLLARQSKYDIRNLSFMHNPTSGTQDQNRYGPLWRNVNSEGFFSGNVERPFAKRQIRRSKTGAKSCN